MRRKVRTTADRYGGVGVHADWQAVMEHYEWDRVDEAYRLATGLGAAYGASVLGTYRMIEGEALTRESGEMVELSDWLTLEFMPSQTELTDGLKQTILDACEAPAQRLGWNHSEKALVSVLSNESDAPWHGARFGYFVDKYPFDKICIPNAATRDAHQLWRTVAHEYTHLIVLNRTEGKAPDWLEEALAMLVEGEPVQSAAFPFRIGRAEWLSPEELDRAFHAERRDPSVYGRVWHAYQQSAVLGHYLLSQEGWEGIRSLLGSFSNNTFWQELKRTVASREPVDGAVESVYDLTVEEAFDAAREWMRGLAF